MSNMFENITEFSGKHFFLSNFYRIPIELDGLIYNSVECAYQAGKFPKGSIHRITIRTLKPGKAKQYARRHVDKQRPNFTSDNRNVVFMEELLRIKFNSHLNSNLVLTYPKDLIEGPPQGVAHWADRFWGKDANGVGENNLGKILMQIREELRDEYDR